MAASRLLGLLALCAAAGGQTANDPSASMQGIVTNSVTGEPLLRAHVSLRLASGGFPLAQSQLKHYGALTTAEGKFSVTGMEPGRYTIAIDKTGFVTGVDQPMVTLQPGEKKDNLKLQLVPTGAIVGRVINADGTPAPSIQVEIEYGLDSFGSITRTDDRGQYRIGGLAQGRYRVRARPETEGLPPEIRTDGTTEVHHGATYYPGVLLPGEATRAEVRPGIDTSGIDIQLVRTPIIRVSGTVSGIPPGTENVQIEVRRGRNGNSGARVKPDGTFVLWNLDPGKYTLQAIWFALAGKRMASSPSDIEVSDANIDHLALNVIPPVDFSGRVEYEDEQARPKDPPPLPPRAGSGPEPVRMPQPRRIALNSLEGAPGQAVDIAPDDTFRLTGVESGRYRFSLTWGPAYVKSLRLGATVTDGPVLDIRNGAPGNALTLVVSSAMGTVAGTVSDGKGPAPAAVVVLMPADFDGMGPGPSVSAKPDGAYSLIGLAPGQYRIGAFDEADQRMLRRSGSLEDLMDQMDLIEIHAGDKLAKDLKLLKP